MYFLYDYYDIEVKLLILLKFKIILLLMHETVIKYVNFNLILIFFRVP